MSPHIFFVLLIHCKILHSPAYFQKNKYGGKHGILSNYLFYCFACFEMLHIKIQNTTRTSRHYKLKIFHFFVIQIIYNISNLETRIRLLYYYTIERNFASVTREEGAPLKYYLCHLQLRLERAYLKFNSKQSSSRGCLFLKMLQEPLNMLPCRKKTI